MKNLKTKAFKSTKGITLIALVVTIIVLLILAGVSIAMLTGNNGVLTQGKRAKEEQAHAAVREGIMLLYNEYKTKQEVNSSKVQEETKVASTELVKIAENEGAEGTTENLGSFKDFIQSKNIINANGIVNVRNLLGQTLSLGNGTSKESGDVYVFEEQDDYYNLTYYNKQIQQAKIYQIKNENAGEKVGAYHYYYTQSDYNDYNKEHIILVNFKRNDYRIYAQDILKGKEVKEKEKMFLEGTSYWDIKNEIITEPYKSIQEVLNKHYNGKYENLDALVRGEDYESFDDLLIWCGLVSPEEIMQEWEKGRVTGTITCPDGSKVEVSETNNYESIRYPISQPGTYTFTAVTSDGKSSKIDVKVEGKYTLQGYSYVYLLSVFKRIDITNENKPKIKYIKDSVEQEGDLTDCIENGKIDLYDVHSKFEIVEGTNIEITVEVEGKELKWSGPLYWAS